MESREQQVERRLTTPAGSVELSSAIHEDGSISVSAWLMPGGLRVGYLHHRPHRSPDELVLDPMLAGAAVEQGLRTVLEQVLRPQQGQEDAAQRLLRAGRLSAADIKRLLNWQWVLSERGEAASLDELAAAEGLVSASDAPARTAAAAWLPSARPDRADTPPGQIDPQTGLNLNGGPSGVVH